MEISFAAFVLVAKTLKVCMHNTICSTAGEGFCGQDTYKLLLIALSVSRASGAFHTFPFSQYHLCNFHLHFVNSFLSILLLQILEEEVRAYDSVIEELSREANRLIGDGHFDCSNITARQVCLSCVCMPCLLIEAQYVCVEGRFVIVNAATLHTFQCQRCFHLLC